MKEQIIEELKIIGILRKIIYKANLTIDKYYMDIYTNLGKKCEELKYDLRDWIRKDILDTEVEEKLIKIMNQLQKEIGE